MQCSSLAEQNNKLLDQLRRQREELEAEKLANAQVKITYLVCLNLYRKLFYFKLTEKLSLDSRAAAGRSFTRTETLIRTSESRIIELESQVEALKLVRRINY